MRRAKLTQRYARLARILTRRGLFTLLPGRCLVCKASTLRDQDLCRPCEKSLPIIERPCWQCGLTNPGEADVCNRCLYGSSPIDHIFSRFAYSPPLDRLISLFKNQGDLALGAMLATTVAEAYIASHQHFPEVWLPVPLHPHRVTERGFNQSDIISAQLSSQTNVPTNHEALSRVSNSAPQKGLSLKDRQKTKNPFLLAKPIGARSVGIVDDVITSGITVTHLAGLLKSSGVEEVQVVSIARTPLTH